MFDKIKQFLNSRAANLVMEGIGFGIFVITCVILAAILQGVQTSQVPTAAQLAANGNNFTTMSQNISGLGLTGFLQFGTFMGLIALIIVGGYMIKLVAGFLGGGGTTAI